MAKIMYFICFGIGILQTLFYVVSFFNLANDPYKKLSEAIIFAIAAFIMGGGVFWAHRLVDAHSNHLSGIGILVGAWIVALLSVLIGLLFFNGPIKWN